MKALRLAAARSAFSILLLLAAGSAGAQGVTIGGYSPPPAPPIARPGGGFIGFPGFWPVEREVVYVEREVVREVPAEPATPPAPPPPPRKPFVIGRTYSSLPGGCMKMIDDGTSYFHCSGEWYRQIGSSSYKAVSQP